MFFIADQICGHTTEWTTSMYFNSYIIIWSAMKNIFDKLLFRLQWKTLFFIADQIIVYEKQCFSLQTKYAATPPNEPRQCILTHILLFGLQWKTFLINYYLVCNEKQCFSLQTKYVATPLNEPRQCILTHFNNCNFSKAQILCSLMMVFHTETCRRLIYLMFMGPCIVIIF